MQPGTRGRGRCTRRAGGSTCSAPSPRPAAAGRSDLQAGQSSCPVPYPQAEIPGMPENPSQQCVQGECRRSRAVAFTLMQGYAPSPPGWTLRLLQTSKKRSLRALNLQRCMRIRIKPSPGLSCSCFRLRRFHGTRGRCRRQGWVRPVHTFLRRDKMGCCRGQQHRLPSEQSDASASACQNRSDPCWVGRLVPGGWAHFAFKCHPAPHLPERTIGRPAGAAISRPEAIQLWL